MKGEINMSVRNLRVALLLAVLSWAIVGGIVFAVLHMTSPDRVVNGAAIPPVNITGVY